MRILGVIPARGGSKGVPRKNLQPVDGVPLVVRALRAAAASTRLTRTIVSTDDDEIAQIALDAGGDVPFRRPADLAADHAQAIPNIQHALTTVEELEGGSPYDAVMMLQPTTPFRTAEDIDAAVDLLETTGADSVISVVDVGGHHPARMHYVDRGELQNHALSEAYENQNRQELRPMFIRNGAIYLTRRDVLLDGSFRGKVCRAYEMPPERSVNIDGELDFLFATWLAERGAPVSVDHVEVPSTTRPIIQVGPTKTASTWLQEVVFPGLDGVEVLGRKAVGEMVPIDQELVDAGWELVQAPDSEYHPGRFADLVAGARRAASRMLVADEGLLSTMRYVSREQLDRTADRLHREVPEAQIVLVIRNPVTLIGSTYRHYVRRGGTLSLPAFCRAANPGFTFCPEVFDMGYLVDLFASRYGSDNVVILVYEELADDPRAAVETLTTRLDLRESPGLAASLDASGARNTSLSLLACGLLRRTNRLFASRFNPDGPIRRTTGGALAARVRRLDQRLGVRGWGLERRVERRAQAVLAEVGSQYARSHARLAAATGLDLQGHGYPWPAD